MSAITLIGGDAESASALQQALQELDVSGEVGLAPAEAVADAVAGTPDAFVLGPLIDVGDALRVAAEIAPLETEREVVMVTPEPSTETLRHAMRLGVRDVLPSSAPFSELASAVRLAVEAGQRRRPSALPSSEVPAGGKVVTVFGTKGGVGKTVIATNVAVSLAQSGSRVILVDLDLQSGDAGIMLQLRPEHTIFDVMRSFDRLDPEMLRAFLVQHPSGLQALLAPVRPEQAEGIGAVRVASVLEQLRDMADFVVVDTPAVFNDVVLAALERSDGIYVAATMDLPSIKNLKVSLQKLVELGLDRGGTRIVLNRADSRVGLVPKDAEEAAGRKIDAQIPSDRVVPRAVNKGMPVVEDAPRSPAARSLAAVAESVRSVAAQEVRADVA